MRIHRLDQTGIMWITTGGPLPAACLLAAVGCAHHRADQYAYAPPYAPPVYSQPQVQMPAQPASYAAAPGSVPAGAVPVAGVPVAGVPAGAMPGCAVVPAVGGECPPCAEGMQGVVVSSGAMPVTVIEGGGQTPPCPPGL